MIPQLGELIEETTIEFRITVVLQPGDDSFALEDHLTEQVCRFYGSSKCEEGVDCPRLWIAGHSIVKDEQVQRLKTADIDPPLWLTDASQSATVSFGERDESPERYP